ncbi:MAG: ATP-binding cassette domain-containing protein [Alphaproteobacteria bacterium]
MAPPLLSLQQARIGFGGAPLFADLDLAIAPRDRICLVGRNGCGKSTLLRLIAGEIEAEAGEYFVQPGTAVAYLPQDPVFAGYETLLDYVAAGVPELHKAEAAMAALDAPAGRRCAQASGGERRRAALARVFAAEPEVLLLDEPTNHLDLPAIQWLEEALASFRGAVVVISHDRAFLRRVTSSIWWLDRGVLRRHDQGFDKFEDWANGILEAEEATRAKRDKLIAVETDWSHKGITARRRRNEGRIRRLQALRQQRAEELRRVGNVKLTASGGATAGRRVIDAEDISKRFGDNVVLRGFSTRVLRGDRVGLIGPNGAGKTTLLKLLTGRLAPDTGEVRLGTNVQPVFVDQDRGQLDPGKTVWETLCPQGGDMVTVNGQTKHVVGYMRDFLFEERQARAPVGSLSGGERNRLLLALSFTRPANLLVLDEPTNDLDMETLDLLQELLAEYDGTLLLVSHDRDFLDRVVTSTIAMEGDGRAMEYPGGYADYLRQRPARAADRPRPVTKPAADKPKPSAKRLGYKQQRALELLPKQIAALEQEIVDLEARLADPALFARDAAAFNATAQRLDAAKAELETAETEWLELEMLREEVE